MQSTIERIPKALAYLSGNRLDTAFSVDPVARNLARTLAREIPVKHQVNRDPARASVLDKVWSDNTIDPLVKAACVITYTSGARGGNVFRTNYSAQRPDMLIKWSDIEQRKDEQGNLYFLLRIRKEKTAKRHLNAFQPVTLAQATHPGQICPVTAIAIAAAHRTPGTSQHDPIFGKVTAKMVCSALNKHAPQGDRYTSHSLRQGLATDLASTSASARIIQIAGRWGSIESFKPYIRLTHDLRQRMDNEVRAHQTDDQDNSPADALPLPQEANVPQAGQAAPAHTQDAPGPRKYWPHLRAIRDTVNPENRDRQVVILVCRATRTTWRMYFYHALTHQRCAHLVGDPPSYDLASYYTCSNDPANNTYQKVMANTEPVQALPDSDAAHDMETLTEQYRACPHHLKVGILSDRHTPRENAPDTDEQPSSDSDTEETSTSEDDETEQNTHPAHRGRQAVTLRFRPNPPPPRPGRP